MSLKKIIAAALVAVVSITTVFITEPYQMGGIFAENSLHSPAWSEWSEFGLQTES